MFRPNDQNENNSGTLVVGSGRRVVNGRFRGWALGCDVTAAHATVDDEVGAIDEAALVAGEEHDCLGLLDGFAEAAVWEVDFASVALFGIITEPVLQQRRVQRGRAESVEAEAFARVHNGQFTGEGENGAFAGCVSELRRCAADQGDHACCVDDGCPLLAMLAETEDGVLAAEPYAFNVDGVCKVPDLLWRVNGISILRVHDAGIIEENIKTTPRVDLVGSRLAFASSVVLNQRTTYMLDHGLYIGLLGDIGDLGLDSLGFGHNLPQQTDSSLKCRAGYIRKQYARALAKKENCCLQADTTVELSAKCLWFMR